MKLVRDRLYERAMDARDWAQYRPDLPCGPLYFAPTLLLAGALLGPPDGYAIYLALVLVATLAVAVLLAIFVLAWIVANAFADALTLAWRRSVRPTARLLPAPR